MASGSTQLSPIPEDGDTSTSSPPVTTQPRGTDHARRTYTPMKRGQVVSPGMVIAIIAAVGITVGLSILAAHTGATSALVHHIAIGGATLFGIGSASSLILAIIFGCKKYKANKRPLYEPREIAARPQPRNRQPVVREAGDTEEQWTARLQRASKCQANGNAYDAGDAAPCYYDLTHDVNNVQARGQFADRLNLGDVGNFLKIPHFGQYQTGYHPDDHLMAVRLPKSQLATFPQSIQRKLANEEAPELYFMVFKNPAEAGGFSRNISMHAMALSNYNHLSPQGGRRVEGQRAIQTERGGIGLKTTMKIAMCQPVGITTNRHSKDALTTKLKTVDVSIHTPVWPNRNNQHEFSNNHAHFQVNRNADVSHMYVLVQDMPGRPAVAFQAVILNNGEGDHGGTALSLATQQNSLNGFLNVINQDETLGASIKEKIKSTFTHPSALPNNPPIRQENNRFRGSEANRLGNQSEAAQPVNTSTATNTTTTNANNNTSSQIEEVD